MGIYVDVEFDCIMLAWLARQCHESVPRSKHNDFARSAFLSEVAVSEYAHYLPRILGESA